MAGAPEAAARSSLRVEPWEASGTDSSFAMVTTACPSAMVAPSGPLRFTEKVSEGSSAVSPFTATAMLPNPPAAMVSDPDAAT